MEDLLTWLRSPWPWYIGGPMIGLMVPLLLWLGNRAFGISSNLQHGCAMLLPERAKPKLFQYNWKQEYWNILFAAGLVLGGFVAGLLLGNPEPTRLSAAAQRSLQDLGVHIAPGYLPQVLTDLTQLRSWVLLSLTGLLVGFGTRYGHGCTSGHAITGLSTLQLPSLIATCAFFAGGILSANLLLPWLLRVWS